MIEEKELQKVTDYSQGQIEAAYSVLGELTNILKEYSDNMLLIGGWVPTLMYPDKEHIGSIDVDLLLNQQKTTAAKGYENINRILLKNGYRKHPEKYFSYVKTVKIEDVPYDVDVDFLSGKYGGNEGSRSKHIDGVKALPASGGNFAFEIESYKKTIEYQRPDGALDSADVNIVSVIPYLILKAAALGRGKTKDAYDIYFTIKHYPGGVKALAKEFVAYSDKKLIQVMCHNLNGKFASENHAGTFDIVSFLELTDIDDIEMLKQDAYQQIHYLVDAICK